MALIKYVQGSQMDSEECNAQVTHIYRDPAANTKLRLRILAACARQPHLPHISGWKAPDHTCWISSNYWSTENSKGLTKECAGEEQAQVCLAATIHHGAYFEGVSKAGMAKRQSSVKHHPQILPCSPDRQLPACNALDFTGQGTALHFGRMSFVLKMTAKCSVAANCVLPLGSEQVASVALRLNLHGPV